MKTGIRLGACLINRLLEDTDDDGDLEMGAGCEVVDRRSEEQQLAMTSAILARDRFLSGWGRAAEGASYVAWAFNSDEVDAEKLRAWVEDRRDTKDVRSILNGFDVSDVPENTVHFTIYPVTKDHPSQQTDTDEE